MASKWHCGNEKCYFCIPLPMPMHDVLIWGCLVRTYQQLLVICIYICREANADKLEMLHMLTQNLQCSFRQISFIPSFFSFTRFLFSYFIDRFLFYFRSFYEIFDRTQHIYDRYINSRLQMSKSMGWGALCLRPLWCPIVVLLLHEAKIACIIQSRTSVRWAVCLCLHSMKIRLENIKVARSRLFVRSFYIYVNGRKMSFTRNGRMDNNRSFCSI